MKQLNLMAVALLGTLILGACSTSNEVVGGGIFQKRKYTGGVYVDRAEKQKEAKENKKEEDYDISSVNQERQVKYVSTESIRMDEKQTVSALAFEQPKSEVEKVKRIRVKELTDNEEVEFDIYKSSEAKNRKYASSQTIRHNNKVTEIEDVYGDDNAMASNDNELVPASEPAKKEDEAVITSNTKNKKAVKMSSKSLMGAETVLLVILAILLPPLAVGLYEGITTRFWISLLLTILFWLPGVIYAILVVTGTI